MASPSAGTKSEAAGPSEAAQRAHNEVMHRHGGAGDPETCDQCRDALRAAMDPALGDDRLVVAGAERQRIISEVVELLDGEAERQAGIGTDLASTVAGALVGAVEMVKARFGGGS